MSELEQAIAKARALPCWADPQEIEPLEGGITNVNLTLKDRGRKYVVRFGDDIPEHGVMRFNELAISRAAAAAGISPAVHHAEAGVLVLEFADATPLSEADLHDQNTLVDVTRLVARAHREVTALARGPIMTFWVFHVLRDYAGFLSAQNSPHIPMFPQLMEEAERLENAVGKVDLVLGHNDLLPANILRGEDRYWLVDWEYGGFNSPLFDLGGLATNCGLPEEAERLMLTTYFGAEPDVDLKQSYDAMKCASLLRETMWSMVSELTSTIDFDYRTYTETNLERYRRAYESFKGTL